MPKGQTKPQKTLPHSMVTTTVINDRKNSDKMVCPVIRTTRAISGSKLKKYFILPLISGFVEKISLLIVVLIANVKKRSRKNI